MVGLGKEFYGSSSPTPLPKQGHLQQAAQDLIQAGFEYLQRRRLHNLSGQSQERSHKQVPCATALSSQGRYIQQDTSAFSCRLQEIIMPALCEQLATAWRRQGWEMLIAPRDGGCCGRPGRGHWRCREWEEFLGPRISSGASWGRMAAWTAL